MIPGGLLTTKPGRKKRELEQDAAFSLVPIHVFFSYQGGFTCFVSL